MRASAIAVASFSLLLLGICSSLPDRQGVLSASRRGRYWLLRAAVAGSERAQLGLDESYAAGTDGLTDPQAAYEW